MYLPRSLFRRCDPEQILAFGHLRSRSLPSAAHSRAEVWPAHRCWPWADHCREMLARLRVRHRAPICTSGCVECPTLEPRQLPACLRSAAVSRATLVTVNSLMATTCGLDRVELGRLRIARRIDDGVVAFQTGSNLQPVITIDQAIAVEVSAVSGPTQ